MDDLTVDATAVFLAHLESDGKGQLLREHLLSVSEAAGRLSERFGLGAAGAAIGLLHDLGKYSRDFQQYLRRMALDQDTEEQARGRGTIDHSTAGAQAIWREMKSKGGPEGVVGEILALCVASHHSGLIDCITPSGVGNLSRRVSKADADSHYSEARGKAEALVTERSKQVLGDPDVARGVREMVAKICETEREESIRRFMVGLLVRLLFSCLIDADRTDTADSSNRAAASLRQRGRYVGWQVLAGLLEKELESFSCETPIGQLRRQVSEECLSASARPKGIFTLTVPTGGGKTLASLRFALNHAAKWKLERVIYVSPYTSIIDQNADVARAILEPSGTEFASVVLEHHSNLTPLKQTWKSKILSENWDAPVVFTTGVQLLEALFGAGTRAVRRMHQLGKSVVIFDEIQTLPVRCVHLFNNAMNFLVEECGSTVVLCTATQPLLHQVDPRKGAVRLGEDASMTGDVEGLFASMRRHETHDRRKPRGWEHGEVAQLAGAEVPRAGSCLVVVNTKKEAVSIFRECRAGVSEVSVFHLSTGMCPAHRLDILGDVKRHLAAGLPVICVSTQLIEAGVDIDFGSVIRALAGLDSVAQAGGRCNREGRREMGHVYVVNLVGELPKALGDIRAAQEAAQRVLDEEAGRREERAVNLSSPAVMEQYFRYYFFERRKEMDYPVGTDRAERDDTLLNMLSENRLAVERCRPCPGVYLRQAFMTAAGAFQSIDAGTRGVVAPYGVNGRRVIAELCSARQVDKQFGLLKRAQRLTVEVFPHVLEGLEEAGAVYEAQEGTGILCLDEKYYNGDFGLNVEGGEEMEFQNG